MATSSIPRTSGIYKITCSSNQKIYIGSAVNLLKRWQNHRCSLRGNYHGNPYLQNAWNKHSEQSFTFEVIETCELDCLLEREQFHLDTLRPYDRQIGFNQAADAIAPQRGLKLSDETRAKMSASNKGKTLSPEHVARLKEYTKTPEHRAKLSASHKGKKMSPEACAKMSASHKGVKLSPEHCASLAIASTGRKHSPESIERTRQAHIGRKNTPQQNDNVRLGHCKYIYVITSPDGETIEARSLTKFSQDNGLTHSKMYDVANGRSAHHKGWTAKRIEVSR